MGNHAKRSNSAKVRDKIRLLVSKMAMAGQSNGCKKASNTVGNILSELLFSSRPKTPMAIEAIPQ